MKGMQKIKRGTSFKGLLMYALAHEKADEDGRLIGGSMNGFDVKTLNDEFAKTRALRPDVEKPVWHNSLRLPAGDTCSDEKWRDIGEDYLGMMGYDVPKTQFVLVKHDDENAIHVIVNRVLKDGSLYLGRNENLVSTRVISELEKLHGLTQTKGLEYDENNRIKAGQSVHAGRKSAKEVQKKKRTETALPKELVQAAIKKALDQGACSASEFAERMRNTGVTVKANVAKTTRKMNGFSFEVLDASNTKRNTIVFKGSQVGASWEALQKAGVTYYSDKDYLKLASLSLDESVRKDARIEAGKAALESLGSLRAAAAAPPPPPAPGVTTALDVLGIDGVSAADMDVLKRSRDAARPTATPPKEPQQEPPKPPYNGDLDLEH